MSEWVSKPLGNIIALQRGHDLPSQDRKEGDIPIMGSSGITGYHNEAKLSGPGVIVGRSGNSMGEVSFIDEDYWPLNTCLYVTDFKGNDERYIYYLLQTINFDQFNSGSAQKSLNRNAVYPYEVYITENKDEQIKIGRILADFEGKIELNRQINQTLEQIAQAIFKSWFVDYEPVNAKIEAKQNGQDPERAAMRAISGKTDEQLEQLSPDQHQQLATTAALFPFELEDTELGLIPKGWEWSSIGNEVDVVGGGTPSTKIPEFWENGEINWTSPKDLSGLQDKVLLRTLKKITEAGLAKISSGLLPVDTVLMSSRAPVGYLAQAKIPVAINQGYIAMKCTKRLPAEFVLLWADSVMDEIKQRASGSTFAEISKKNFKPIKVVVPAKDVLAKFLENTKTIYDKITESVSESTSLTEIRDSLLPKLLSGKIEVQG